MSISASGLRTAVSSVILRKAVLFAVFIALFGVIVVTVVKVRKHKEKTMAVEKEYIKKAKNYVEEHFSEEALSRDEIAQFVGLTPQYFGHIFKKETNLSLREYFTTVRIEKAKVLLSTTQKTISEISYEVGFGSQSYFDRKFKRIEKISPKEYRHKHQKRS